MASKTNLLGGYVRIDLRDAGDFGFAVIGGKSREESELRRDLENLASAAKLRLDKFQDERGHVSIEFERETVCEHCGSIWSEASKKYNGGCCSKDQDEYEAALAETSGPAF